MNKQQILNILKNEGLDVAEEAVVAAVAASFKMLRVIVPKFSTGAGLMLNFFLDAYEDKIFELLDKIDGEPDLNSGLIPE